MSEMTLKEATEVLKRLRKIMHVSSFDSETARAIDTVVSYCEDPISPKMTREEIIKLFNAAEYVFVNEITSQLTPNKKLVFLKEGFTVEIWMKGQPIEDVVKVIASYDYMRGTERGAE